MQEQVGGYYHHLENAELGLDRGYVILKVTSQMVSGHNALGIEGF